jgi:hypothetical protein
MDDAYHSFAAAFGGVAKRAFRTTMTCKKLKSATRCSLMKNVSMWEFAFSATTRIIALKKGK